MIRYEENLTLNGKTQSGLEYFMSVYIGEIGLAVDIIGFTFFI